MKINKLQFAMNERVFKWFDPMNLAFRDGFASLEVACVGMSIANRKVSAPIVWASS